MAQLHLHRRLRDIIWQDRTFLSACLSCLCLCTPLVQVQRPKRDRQCARYGEAVRETGTHTQADTQSARRQEAAAANIACLHLLSKLEFPLVLLANAVRQQITFRSEYLAACVRMDITKLTNILFAIPCHKAHKYSVRRRVVAAASEGS